MKEKDLQKSIKDYLELKGYLVIKAPTAGIYKHDTGRYIPLGRKGISDLIALKKGIFYAIEIKVPGNTPTLEQQEFLQEVEQKGGVALLAYSIDDVIRTCP